MTRKQRWAAAATLVVAVLCAAPVASQEVPVVVTIATSHGDIIAELYPDRAPVTVANFLRYLDDRAYDGGTFYRSVRMDNQPNDSVRIEVIQAGAAPEARGRMRPPIPLERTTITGLRHVDGALSMARGGPDSATSSFFICIGDQPSLDFGGNRNLDGQGFAAFGRVITGMDVVRNIQMGEVDAQRLRAPVVIESVRRHRTPLPRDAIADVQSYLDSLTATTPIPGVSVGIALPDGSSRALTAGFADTARSVPLRPDGRLMSGSVGKTYFGAVALQLVAEGRLELDAPIESYLGDLEWLDRIPNGRTTTVRQVMSHTSGLVRYELSPGFLADLRADPLRTYAPADRLFYLFDSEAPFVAGEGWEYSDTNYIVLAMILEAVTGRPAYDEIRSRVLEPFRLDETVPTTSPSVPGLVNGYAGPRNPFGDFDETLRDDGSYAINPQFEWGGGGFASTTEDLARWTRIVQEGAAFDDSLLLDFRRGVPAPLGPGGAYGLGTIMLELESGSAWGHSGMFPGYRTEAYFFPDHGFAVAVHVNSSDNGSLPVAPLLMLDRVASILAGAAR